MKRAPALSVVIAAAFFLLYSVLFAGGCSLAQISGSSLPTSADSGSGISSESMSSTDASSSVSSFVHSFSEGSSAGDSSSVDAYEKPQATQFTSWSDRLRIPLMAFVYNSLYNVRQVNDPESAIAILSKFEYLVCAEPAHLAEKETIVADAIKSQVRLFGYVNMGGDPLPSLDTLKTELARIRTAGWYGVFVDQFGYDFGETRERQNALVDYAHSLGLRCFVNAWFIDDALGGVRDAVHNPQALPPSLGEDDWYLMESFYTGSDGYAQSSEDFWQKLFKAKEYRRTTGVKIACLSYKRDAVSWEEADSDIENSYLLATLSGFDGWWFTDRTENDDFRYGEPDLYLGYRLEYSLYPLIPGTYWAQTDHYLVSFDAAQYPQIRREVYDKEVRSGLLRYLLQQWYRGQ